MNKPTATRPYTRPSLRTLHPWRLAPHGRMAVRTLHSRTVVLALVEDCPRAESLPWGASLVHEHHVEDLGRHSDFWKALDAGNRALEEVCPDAGGDHCKTFAPAPMGTNCGHPTWRSGYGRNWPVECQFYATHEIPMRGFGPGFVQSCQVAS